MQFVKEYNSLGDRLLLHTEEIGHRRGGTGEHGGLAAVGGETVPIYGTALTASLFRDQDAGGIIPEAELQLKVQPGSAGGDAAEIQCRRGLTADIKAGVLSEDLIYDEITDLRDAAIRMLALATDIMKDRI